MQIDGLKNLSRKKDWQTFWYQLSRKLSQPGGQQLRWRRTGQGCSQDFSSKSTTASKCMIWIVPIWTENTVWGSRDPLPLVVGCSTPSPEPCFSCSYSHICQLKAQNFTISEEFWYIVICFDLLVQGWWFVVLSKVHFKPNLSSNWAHFQHPCCWVILFFNFRDLGNRLR